MNWKPECTVPKLHTTTALVPFNTKRIPYKASFLLIGPLHVVITECGPIFICYILQSINTALCALRFQMKQLAVDVRAVCEYINQPWTAEKRWYVSLEFRLGLHLSP